MVNEAYPLSWPTGRIRTPPSRRQYSRFHVRRGSLTNPGYKTPADIPASDAIGRLLHELDMIGAKENVVSANLPLRRDGQPYATGAERVEDPGVAVYFKYKGQQTAMCCDRWIRIADNMVAIAKTIEALRGIDRWGSGDMVRAAFTGFRALPAMEKSWRQVLEFSDAALPTEEEIKKSFLEKAKRVHPDVGGFEVLMSELNRARDSAIRELNGEA